MQPIPNPREAERFYAIKVYRAAEYSWPEIIQFLIDDGLIECKNHRRFRPSKGAAEVCMTCEMTVTQFWRRNLQNLSDEEVSLLEVRWQFTEALEWSARMCRDHARRDIEDITEVTTIGEDGKPVTVRTIHRETKIDRGLLRLYAHLRERIAKVSGLDIEDPDPLAKTQRKLLEPYERTDADEGAPN